MTNLVWQLKYMTVEQGMHEVLRLHRSRLSIDPNVLHVEMSEDSSTPHIMYLKVTFREGVSGPKTAELRGLHAQYAADAPLRDFPALQRDHEASENLSQKMLDEAYAAVDARPDAPPWVRQGRWVRNIEGGWTARIEEVIPGVAPRVRFVNSDYRRTALRPPEVMLCSMFVQQFEATDVPPAPLTFYERLRGRRLPQRST